MNEEELKELKNQNLINSEKDIKIFEKLYKTLSITDRSFELSDSFEVKMKKMILQRKREERFERIILISGGMVLFIAALITLAVTGVFDNADLFGNMQWYVVIFLLMILVFRKIEKRYFKSS